MKLNSTGWECENGSLGSIKRAGMLLLSQVYVCCHGNLRCIFWVAVGYCVCSISSSLRTDSMS